MHGGPMHAPSLRRGHIGMKRGELKTYKCPGCGKDRKLRPEELPLHCSCRMVSCLRDGELTPVVKEVRGKGLLIGVELTTAARSYCEGLRDEGILAKETHGTVIRLAPPLVIDRDTIDWALERIEKVLMMD